MPARRSFLIINGISTLCLFLVLTVRPVNGQGDTPITINFDNLPNNTVITNQYFSQYGVTFSSGNPSLPLHTQQACNLCAPITPPNFACTWPDISGQVIVEFSRPVSNLSFIILASDAFFNQFALLDVYRNGAFSNTFGISGNGTSNVGVTLGTMNSITKIVIRNINDAAGVGFDNFTFTLPDVKITNSRVSGNLAGTLQNALIGADVALTANGTPAGGTYSWSFTGSPSIVSGAANQASVGIRWTQQSTFRATVTYTKDGSTATAFVDVNNRMPALTNFTATEASDRIARDQFCSNLPAGVTYTLGCYQNGPEDGIIWSATAQIPSLIYLSNPAQSGIKFVQAVSDYRKRLRDGNLQCFTARSSESNIASGWQLDTVDPYNHSQHPPQFFSQGNTLTMSDFDAPGSRIEGTTNGTFFSNDAFLVSGTFEVYVFYFTGSASTPNFQQAIGLSGSGSPFARLAWSWGGETRFDSSTAPILHRLISTTTISGQIAATGTNATVPMTTNANTLTFVTCPDATATSNPIDGSLFFTQRLYLDFLNRTADESGLNFWRGNITQCGFDLNCVGNKRIDVARAFFYSTEFIGTHPGLAGSRGTHDYNAAFLLACYEGFLRREPNDPPDNNFDGFNFWLNILDSTNPDASDGKYNQIINAFLQSTEYRSRFGPP